MKLYYYFFCVTILALRCRAGLFLEQLPNITEIKKRGFNITRIVEGDLVVAPRSGSAARGAVCESCGRWLEHADGTYHVPYEFGPGAAFPAHDLKRFEWAFAYQATVTNLKYLKRTTENDYISIMGGREVGCFSYVGRWGSGQYLGIGTGCESITTINHEFGHALGLGHEQSRIDSDQYITIHWENITPGVEAQFQYYDEYYNKSAEFSPYDIASIMHYGDWSFRRAAGLKTITTKDPALNKLIEGSRLEFSICDITEINLMYPGKKKPPTCVPHLAPSGFEPVPAYQTDNDKINVCRYWNEWYSLVNRGNPWCQVVGGAEFPPIPPGILTEDTTAGPTTTVIPTTTVNPTTTMNPATTVNPTTIAGETTIAKQTTNTKTTKRNCRLVK